MITLHNLTKCYGKQVIFDRVNWQFPNTGLQCLLAPSGSGKSTLFHLLAGFDQAFQGELTVCGIALHGLSQEALCRYRRDHIGFIFQNYHLLTGYTVYENIALAYALHEHDSKKVEETITRTLEMLNILEKKDVLIEHLSGGQKQRVAIARALIHQPSILLADEPTGALDQQNADQIMKILKELSKDRLVLIITHDKRIAEYADEILSIESASLIGKACPHQPTYQQASAMPIQTVSASRLGWKNFKVHQNRFFIIALSIAIGVFAFLLSLSFRSILYGSISEFKDKNTAFQTGYIKVEESPHSILSYLQEDQRIKRYYQQYVLSNMTLSFEDQDVQMEEKYPMSKGTQVMSYGTMPSYGKREISLSPSLAKQLHSHIDQLIGKEITLQYKGEIYQLTISGIFNAGYDDFFLSSDLEQSLYSSLPQQEPYAISYEVETIDDVVDVENQLREHGIKAETATKEVDALLTTFQQLSRLFFMISLLLFIISCIISWILLGRLQSTRHKEIGLLSALGYSKSTIQRMLLSESLYLTITASLILIFLLSLMFFLSSLIHWELELSFKQILLSMCVSSLYLFGIGIFMHHRLLRVDPIIALKSE